MVTDSPAHATFAHVPWCLPMDLYHDAWGNSGTVQFLACSNYLTLLSYFNISIFLSFFLLFQACAFLASAYFCVSLLFPTLVEVDWPCCAAVTVIHYLTL